MERMTPDEARTLPLAKNPISRIRQLRRYAGEILAINDGERLPLLYTRRQLVQYAELGEMITSREVLEATTDTIVAQFNEIKDEYNFLNSIPSKENTNGKDF